MNPENQQAEKEKKNSVFKVTPLSKHLFMALFVILPFVGAWIGYTFAPEKLVELEKTLETETEADKQVIIKDVPFGSVDRKFTTDDISWSLDVFLAEGKLFWKPSYKEDWDHLVVRSPENVEYIGFGVFADGGDTYSLGYLQGSEVLDAAKEIQVISEKGQDLMRNGEKLFALVSEMSLPVLAEVKNIDVENFEIIGGGYLKDASSVFFMGASTWVLKSANPKIFTTYRPDANYEKFILGISGENVYYDEKLLEGINFSEMVVENYNSIIRDSDTVWYSSGNCHFGDFTKGELDKIKTYQPPC